MLARRMDAREHPEADDALQSVSRTFAACDSAVPKPHELRVCFWANFSIFFLACSRVRSLAGGGMPHSWG